MALTVKQGHQDVTQRRQGQGPVAGSVTGSVTGAGGRDRCPLAPLAAGQIQEVEPGAASSHAPSTAPVHAVLVHVEGVEEVRVGRLGGALRRPRRQRRVKVEGRLLQRRRPQLALVLQLRSQQRVLAQVNAGR